MKSGENFLMNYIYINILYHWAWPNIVLFFLYNNCCTTNSVNFIAIIFDVLYCTCQARWASTHLDFAQKKRQHTFASRRHQKGASKIKTRLCWINLGMTLIKIALNVTWRTAHFFVTHVDIPPKCYFKLTYNRNETFLLFEKYISKCFHFVYFFALSQSCCRKDTVL